MTVAAFDPLGPLPSGRLVIEASAGTGKTFALSTLATRFVAEGGVAADELLVVTFTRAATSELRSRIRRSLHNAAQHLQYPSAIPTDDPLLLHLSAGDRVERGARLTRLRRAVLDFDAATITTIHGFAAQALGGLHATSGSPRRTRLVADLHDELAAVCADIVAAASVRGAPSVDLSTHTAVLAAARLLTESPDLTPLPGDEQWGATPEVLSQLELIGRAIDEFRHRRHVGGTSSFSDLLTDLVDALHGPAGDSIVDALRRRYRVALIDEFQDTDPAQWEIFETVFGASDGAVPLVLVGDPKQAIYSFRGANIHTYLHATEASRGVTVTSLGTNWRSDQQVLTALSTLFEGAAFGDPRIRFTSVSAAPAHRSASIATASGAPMPAMAIRTAVDGGLRSPKGTIAVETAVSTIFADLAVEVASLLERAQIPDREPPPSAVTDGTGSCDATDGELVVRRRLRPNDIAVLVRTGDEATGVQRALLERGIPAVVSRGSSVFDAPAATQWRWLLEALARPADIRRARTFALSWFGGWSGDQLLDATDLELAAVQTQLHDWAATLSERGAVEAIRRILADSRVAERVLAGPHGDRNLTDLLHISELLQITSTPDATGPAALLNTLATRDEVEAETDTGLGPEARRVESDADAVQVMTIWVSKGLQFPVVCLPTLWRAFRGGQHISVDPDDHGRVLDLAPKLKWPDELATAERRDREDAEVAGEQLRLAYVALTRAQHHSIVWWSAATRTDRTALARLLFARYRDATIDPVAWLRPRVSLPTLDDTDDVLRVLVARSGGAISLAAVPPQTPRMPRPTNRRGSPADAPRLDAATLNRELDRRCHRWSFTLITSRLPDVDQPAPSPLDDRDGDGGAADEPDVTPTVDELADREVTGVPGSDPDTPWGGHTAGLPAGAAFGSLVHELLEHLDFRDPDLARQATDHAQRLATRWPGALPFRDAPRLGAALAATIATPLGASLGGMHLGMVAQRDRLNEVGFDLRLAGGGSAASLTEVGSLILDHLDPDDPLRGWATRLRDGYGPSDLAGHLTGSIDLVVRYPAAGVGHRYLVVDYKTNRLASYDRRALAAAMADHHYPLQALLYSVALHRYLRWRVADYDPGRHLGGIAYLFVRGMVGASTPVVDGHTDGVFDWAPPVALVGRLSDLLDGRRGGRT